MASKNLWVAELQNRDGKVVEYHSIDLDPEHYDKGGWNRAMTSWSNFRERERANLKPNRPRNSRCKWAVSWRPADDAMYQLLGLPEGIKHHKTIWDLYEAIGYNYKAKKYERDATVVAIDPGSEDSAIEATFEGGTITKVRSLASEDTSMSETKPRGINNGLIHLDEAGFMTKDGQPVYVATGDGSHSQFVRDKTTGQYVPVETVTVAECVALGDGVLAEPASLEEANRLRAEAGLEPLLAQPAPEGFEITAPNPEDWQEPAPEVQGIKNPFNGKKTEFLDPGLAISSPNPGVWQEGPANEVTLSLADDKTAQYTVKLDGSSFTVRSNDLPRAQQIADKVNAEPDIEAKKRIIDAEMRHYHSEQERLADAQRIKSAILMPNDPRKQAKVRAHKVAVVKKHQKLLRKQQKQEKQRALQARAFNGK